MGKPLTKQPPVRKPIQIGEDAHEQIAEAARKRGMTIRKYMEMAGMFADKHFPVPPITLPEDWEDSDG